MKQKVHFFLLLCLLGTGFNALADNINFLHDWDEALEQARAAEKPIFLDAYTTWCGPCKWMAAKVMTQPEVARFYNDNFINVKLDMEKEEGIAVAKQFKIAAYPTLMYFTPTGRAIYREAGGRDAEKFIAMGKKVLVMDDGLQGMYDRYDSGKFDRIFLRDYLLHASESHMDYQDALTRYEEISTPEVIHQPEDFKVFTTAYRNPENQFFPYFKENLEDFIAEFGEAEVMTAYYNFYLEGAAYAIYYKQPDRAEQYLNEIAGQGPQEIRDRHLETAYRLTKAQEGPVAAYRSFHEWFEQGRVVNPDQMSRVAGAVSRTEGMDVEILNMASIWAARSVELEPVFEHWHTYALVMHALGENDRAIELLQRAIEVAKADSEDSSEARELLDQLQK